MIPLKGRVHFSSSKHPSKTPAGKKYSMKKQILESNVWHLTFDIYFNNSLKLHVYLLSVYSLVFIHRIFKKSGRSGCILYTETNSSVKLNGTSLKLVGPPTSGLMPGFDVMLCFRSQSQVSLPGSSPQFTSTPILRAVRFKIAGVHSMVWILVTNAVLINLVKGIELEIYRDVNDFVYCQSKIGANTWNSIELIMIWKKSQIVNP